MSRQRKVGDKELDRLRARATLEHSVIKRVESMVGYAPVGSLDLLRIFAHPDVIDLTHKYINHVMETNDE